MRPSELGHGETDGISPGGGHPPVSGSSTSALAYWVPGQDAWGAGALRSRWDSAHQFLDLPIAREKKSSQKSPPVKKGALKSSRFVAKRRDAPHVLPSLGAKKRITSERLSSGEQAALMRNHEKHKYANSSRAGKITHLRIWTKLHKKRFGNWTPVLPLTPEKIRAVASQMRKRHYRSFQNYMSTLRRWHVKKGYS